MTSNSAAGKQGSRWGSFLSGAVAGLESRLDTILAEESDASAKAKAAETGAKDNKVVQVKDGATLQPPPNGLSRSPSKASRNNDRLQERLAKAMVNKSAGSQAGSELSSPALRPTSMASIDSPRTSLDSRPSMDLPRPTSTSLDTAQTVQKLETAQPAPVSVPDAATMGRNDLQTSSLPINPAQGSADALSRPSTDMDSTYAIVASKSSLESDALPASAEELQSELILLRAEREEEDRRKQEEMDTVLERVDALQAKLQYLARETVAAAKEANGTAAKGSLEQKVAEKDEQIAQLMEEGTNLSKTEMRHLANIRKLSAKVSVEEKTSSDLRKEIVKLRKSETETKTRLGRLEQAGKEDADRISRLSAAESQLLAVTLELSSKEGTITDLRRRLELSQAKLESMEGAAIPQASLVADTRRIGDLEEEVANAKIEKKLAEDRLRLENQRLLQVMEQQKDKAQGTELELKTEITALEARMEALRLRAEEASSDRTEDSQAKLLRQMELLQTQYALAAENWRTIEGSLNARLTAVEKERDEGSKRETELRKKARDLGLRYRKLEDELDSGTDRTSTLGNELSEQKTLVGKLEARIEAAEQAAEEARLAFENEKQALEASFAAKLEQQRSRDVSVGISASQRSKRTGSPTTLLRKSSATENYFSNHNRRGPHRYPTNDSLGSFNLYERQPSRRPSGLPSDYSRNQSPIIEQFTSPTQTNMNMSRKQSAFSLSQLNGSQGSVVAAQADTPPTPSISTTDAGATNSSPALTSSALAASTAPSQNTGAGAGDDDTFSRHSPTPGDMVSASTVHTGPSVALVERMSSSIRRLEAEKAAHRDELARLTAQRDEARDHMVGLLREAEASRVLERKAVETGSQLDALRGRYDACLEMLGEREEQVEELRGDLGEMKRIYKELVAQMGRE